MLRKLDQAKAVEEEDDRDECKREGSRRKEDGHGASKVWVLHSHGDSDDSRLAYGDL